MLIHGAEWFTSACGECIGIVYGSDEVTGERKAYISMVGGLHEEDDVNFIAKHGTKVNPSQLHQISDFLKEVRDEVE